MKRHRFFRRGGGASIFLCIILSAVILTEGVLYFAARVRGYEAELSRCMRLQISQILCSYNEDLLENYGLYGLDSSSVNTQIFDACFTGKDEVQMAVVPLGIMTASDLQSGISDYMRIRMPAVTSGEIISRFKSICTEIEGCDLFKKAAGAKSSAWLGYVKDFLGQKEKWSGIIDSVVSAASVIDTSGRLKDLEEFSKSFQKTLQKSATLSLQGESGSGIYKEILDPDSLSDVMEYVDKYMDYDLPDIADSLLINEYAVSFFDSKIESIKDGEEESPEANLLGIPYSTIHSTNTTDLEYILTGIENEYFSFGAAKILICNMRTIVNFGTYLVDSEKMNKAREISEVLSTAIAAASVGTIYVDPQVLQFVVLYVWALGQAFADVIKLINGESIPIFDHSALSDNPLLEEVLMTDYRDCVGIFLVAVPMDWKLSRILKILNRDCGCQLYTGVCLSAQYRGSQFLMEDKYDAYMSEQ